MKWSVTKSWFCQLFLCFLILWSVSGLPVIKRPTPSTIGGDVWSRRRISTPFRVVQARKNPVRELAMLPLRGGGGLSAGRRNFFKSAGAIVVGIPLALEVYSRAGAILGRKFPSGPFPDPEIGTWNDVETITLVFHGASGQDQYTDVLMRKLKPTSKDRYSALVDWSGFSSNLFQASYNGQRVGREAVDRILKQAPNVNTIHLIGISVGAFAADAASKRTKDEVGSTYVQLTLLDPFTQRGIFDFGYGNRSFGTSADYAQQYLNTDDPVPSTNSPLSNTVCYDITPIRPAEIFGHDWPVAYYGRSSGAGQIIPASEQLERGTVIRIDE